MKCSLGNLVFELTEACNQNCRFCYNHWRPDGSRPVDERLARRTLSRIFKQAQVGCISLSGGEPMLLENILDLALKCRFKGAEVNVLSNGNLLSEADIDNFGSIGINALQIPLLGSRAETHDHLAGVPGSWERACTSIRHTLERLGPEHYAAVLIVTALNATDLPETLEFYKQLGIRKVMVNRFNPGGNGLKHLEELILSRKALRDAFRAISDFSLSNPQMDFVSGVCTPVCVLDPADFPGIRFTSCTTDIQSRPVTISYRGEVRFCNHSPFVLGNIWERDLGEILSDPAIQIRYSGVPQQCRSCNLFTRCKGGCRAASEQTYGSFDQVDPIFFAQ